MKHQWILLTAACLLLTACAGRAASDPMPLMEEASADAVTASQPPEEYEEPEYEVIPLVYGDQFRTGDEGGEVLGYYNYQTISLALRNGAAISPADAETAARNIAAFNSKMEALSRELVEQGKAMAADAEAVYQEFGSLTAEYEDSADLGANFCGSIISVYLHRSNYTGGAHPNHYTASYLFDLALGQFIDPIQLAEDPEVFRTGAAALLLEQAEAHEAREMFWEDYADVIARWNESAVQFTEEGMRVTYSPYEIGPYAIGEVEFVLSWEELLPLIGESGAARLGRGASEAQP